MISGATSRIALVLLCAVALLPIALVPGASIERGMQQDILSGAVLGLGLFIMGVAIFAAKGRITLHPSLLFLAGLPISLIALASSGPRAWDEYFGTSLEFGTAGSLILCTVVVGLWVCVPRRSVRAVLLASAFACALFAFASIASNENTAAHNIPHPSIQATELVLASSFLAKTKFALIGTAEPYGYAWYRFQPLEVNTSPLWGVTPESSGVGIFDIAMRWGFLGLIAFFLIPACAVYAVFAHIRARGFDIESMLMHVYAFLLASAVLFLDVSTPILLAYALAIGGVYRMSMEDSPTVFPRYVGFGAGAALLVLGALCATIGVRQWVGAEFSARGSAEGVAPVTRVQYLELAARAWPTTNYLVEASRAVYTHEFASRTPTAENKDALLKSLASSVAHVHAARGRGSKNVDMWLYGASLHIALIPVGYPDTVKDAGDFLAQAAQLAPKRPEVSYLYALLAARSGDMKTASARASEALKLKPDYADAQELLRQVESAASNQIQ